jgi:hypothetical protein
MRAVVDLVSRDQVTGRWFDLWAGAVAINAICVASGYPGTSLLRGGLGITLDTVFNGLNDNCTTTK